jgi:hypothetical protein
MKAARHSSQAGGLSASRGISGVGSRRLAGAFTLVEVLIAGGILFVCLFSILGLVSNTLRNARALQGSKEDPRGSVMADLFYEFTHTNVLYEGSGFGKLKDWNYDWERVQIQSNGLCWVGVVINPSAHGQSRPQKIETLMYLPQMQQSPGGGAR